MEGCDHFKMHIVNSKLKETNFSLSLSLSSPPPHCVCVCARSIEVKISYTIHQREKTVRRNKRNQVIENNIKMVDWGQERECSD